MFNFVPIPTVTKINELNKMFKYSKPTNTKGYHLTFGFRSVLNFS